MPKQKVAAFFVFLKECRETERGTMAPQRLREYAAAQWAELDANARLIYKERADRINAEARKIVQCTPATGPVKPIPIDLMPRATRNLTKADEFMKCCGSERIALMNRDFVTVCIGPIFKNPNCDNEMDYYPGEVALVKWSIAKGIREVYQVFLDPDIPKTATFFSHGEWNECTQETSCKDVDIIAEEIVKFVGRAGAMLTRSSTMEKTESCLNFILQSSKVQIELIDQAIVTHRLLCRELNTKKKDKTKILLADVKEKFPAKTGILGIRCSINGSHTGVRCAWHSNNTTCSARRAVEDSYVMTKELGTVYQANCVPGRHTPTEGRLIPRKIHNCRHRIDLDLFLASVKAKIQREP